MEITRGKIAKAQKCVIYGPEGIGKSTFLAQFPGVLFIDTEGSTSNMDVARMPKPSSWTMLMSHVAYIKAHPATCKTLAIDTADWAEQLCVEHICSRKEGITGIEDFGYGKGYVYLAEEWGRFLNALTEVIDTGVNVAVSAHAKMRKFEQPDETGAYDRWELKLSKTTAPLLKEWADMVLFANYKTLVVNVDNQGAAKGKNKAQGGQRIIYTSHHPCWDAKNRHDLPEEIPLNFSAIAHCIPAGTIAKSATVATPAGPVNGDGPTDTEGASPENKIRWWHNAAGGCVFETNTDAEAAEYAAEGNCVEIGESEYNALRNKYINEAQATTDAKEETANPAPDDLAGLPVALTDLMRQDGVTAQEVKAAVAAVGYYTEDTPFANYDAGFIQGCLIGAWPQVMARIKELREVKNKFEGDK